MSPIHRTSRSRRRRVTLAATTTAVCALAVATPAALAGPYEQVTRANGPQGASAFTTPNQPLAVSDSGRYAVFSPRAYSVPPKAPLVVRDIITNKSTTLAGNATLIGFDKHDKTFATVEPNASGESSAIWVRSTTGAPARKVVDLDPSRSASYAFSGDGNVVAVAEEWGQLKLYDVSTGAVQRTVEGTGNLALTARSLSDDGTIVAGIRDWSQGFYVKADGTLVELEQPGIVSPDGTVVATGWGSTVTATKVADGTSRSYDAPSSQLLWIAPDGSSIITADTDVEGDGARKLDFATGAWSAYGAQFSSALDGNLVDPVNATQTAISRNGKYGLIQYGRALSNQLALVNLAGGDLPGNQEPLSASSYVPFAPPISFSCSSQPEANLIGAFIQPASWAPKPRLAAIQVKVDGKTVFNKVLTKPFSVYDAGSLSSSLSIPFSTSAKSIRISAAVLDGNFQPLADTETTAPICIG